MPDDFAGLGFEGIRAIHVDVEDDVRSCGCVVNALDKTQIALEYAYRHALEYSAVFWIEAKRRKRRFPVCCALPRCYSCLSASRRISSAWWRQSSDGSGKAAPG